MVIPRLRPDNTVLFIIDIHETVMRFADNQAEMLRKCEGMLRVAGLLDLPVIVTEHWVAKFGKTMAQVLEAVPKQGQVIEKVRFSAFSDQVQAVLKDAGRPNVLVAGIEAHICVLQTTLDLLDAGYNVFLLEDAIGAGEQSQVAPALERMKRHGAIPTGMVSASYELMEDPNHPAFRSVLGEIKGVLSDLNALA
jgi:nicotinamidase-related amidase